MAELIMTELSEQGTLGTGSITLYTCPIATGSRLNLKFNNPAANTVSLKRYDNLQAITTTVYTFNLAAGDVVIDNNNYYLRPGDYIAIDNSVAGTNYVIQVFEFR